MHVLTFQDYIRSRYVLCRKTMRSFFVAIIFALCLTSGFALTLRGRKLDSVQEDTDVTDENDSVHDSSAINGKALATDDVIDKDTADYILGDNFYQNDFHFRDQSDLIRSFDAMTHSLTSEKTFTLDESNLLIDAQDDGDCDPAEHAISCQLQINNDLKCKETSIAQSSLGICVAYADSQDTTNEGLGDGGSDAAAADACDTALCIPELSQTDAGKLQWDSLRDVGADQPGDKANADAACHQSDDNCVQCVGLDENTINTHFTSLAVLNCAFRDLTDAANVNQLALQGQTDFDHSVHLAADTSACSDLTGDERDIITAFHNSVQEQLLAPLFNHAMTQCREIEQRRAEDRVQYNLHRDGAIKAQKHFGKLLNEYEAFNDKVNSEYSRIVTDLEGKSASNQAIQNQIETQIEEMLEQWKRVQRHNVKAWVEDIVKKGTGYDEAIAAAAEDAKKRVVMVNQLAEYHQEKSEQIAAANADLATLDGTLATVLDTLQTAVHEVTTIQDNRDNVLAARAGPRNTDMDYDNVTHANLNYSGQGAEDGSVSGVTNAEGTGDYHVMYAGGDPGGLDCETELDSAAINTHCSNATDPILDGRGQLLMGETNDDYANDHANDYTLQTTADGSGGVCNLCAA